MYDNLPYTPYIPQTLQIGIVKILIPKPLEELDIWYIDEIEQTIKTFENALEKIKTYQYPSDCQITNEPYIIGNHLYSLRKELEKRRLKLYGFNQGYGILERGNDIRIPEKEHQNENLLLLL